MFYDEKYASTVISGYSVAYNIRGVLCPESCLSVGFLMSETIVFLTKKIFDRFIIAASMRALILEIDDSCLQHFITNFLI